MQHNLIRQRPDADKSLAERARRRPGDEAGWLTHKGYAPNLRQ